VADGLEGVDQQQADAQQRRARRLRMQYIQVFAEKIHMFSRTLNSPYVIFAEGVGQQQADPADERRFSRASHLLQAPRS
jgi:hypothetical protein